MANEFHYSVSLTIVHPSMDPKSITSKITHLVPTQETLVGTERRNRQGELIEPKRKAAVSVWSADLHVEERLDSRDVPFSDFLLGQLEALKIHRDLFQQLRKEGSVALSVWWFGHSSYSADTLYSEMLKECGDLGVDIELNVMASPAVDSESTPTEAEAATIVKK